MPTGQPLVMPMPTPSVTAPATAPLARVDGWVSVALCLALVGTGLALDPYAEAAFDAPKRLLALTSAAIGAGALVWHMRFSAPDWRRWRTSARLAVLGGAAAALGLIVSTLLAAHSETAPDALRTMLLYALFVALGAAPLASGGRIVRRVYAAALFAVMANVVLSLLQSAGFSLPIPMAAIGGRFPTGALLGNEGYVALAAALVASASFAWALNTRQRAERVFAWVVFVAAAAAIVVNHQLTSAIALGSAVIAILCVRWRKPSLVVLGAAGLCCALLAALVPAARNVTWAALPVNGVEGYQALTTYRLGAWAAAMEMIEARPWTGFGPGSYAQESQRMRLQAELRWRSRLLPPPTGTTFVVAHQDYLQLAAEAGLPVLCSVLLAAGALVGGLLRAAHSPGAVEPLALLGVLTAGAVSALAWFPLQIPLTAVMLLWAAGRAWRLLAQPPAEPG